MEADVADLLASFCFREPVTALSPSATLLALPLWTNRFKKDMVEARGEGGGNRKITMGR